MKPRFLRFGAAVAALLLVGGPLAVSGHAVDDGALSAGSASASSVFITYYDTATIFQGGTLPPLDVNIGFSSGDIDRSGSSGAVAALAYSPYVDLPPAVNALAGTNINFDPILSSVRASVTGQPPKDADASLTTPTDITEAGTAQAHLTEGPALDAFSTLARIEPAPSTRIRSAASHIKVARVAGNSVTSATTVLRGVDIAGVLKFDSISLSTTSSADGGAGDAQGSVVIEGATIAGMPVNFTDKGIEAAGKAVPMDLSALKAQLTKAGIDLIAPGEVDQEPGAERSVTIATGPHITFTSPQGNTVEIVLGRAIASSTLLPGFSFGSLPEVSPVIPPVAPLPIPVTQPVLPLPDTTVATQPVVPGQRIVDLSRLVLNDSKSIDAFAALYAAIAVGGILMLMGLVGGRRRSLLDERFR